MNEETATRVKLDREGDREGEKQRANNQLEYKLNLRAQPCRGKG